MLSKQAALDMAVEVWDQHQRVEMPRLDRIDQALKVDPPLLRREFIGEPGRGRYAGAFQPTVVIPDDAPPLMWELARKSRTNYLPLLVRVYRQALRVEGYITSAPDAESPWRWWQQNRMDARQGGLHDSTLKYGAAYLSVLRGDTGPACRGYTPRRMAAVYADPEVDEWPAYTVHIDDSTRHLVLTDEEGEYRFGVEDAAAVGGFAGLPALSRRIGPDAVTYIDTQAHDAGVCPVVRYRDSMLLDGEEQYGIVEPLMVVQERIDETGFGQLVAQYFAAFKQRAVIGWVPESEAEELKAGAARIWYLDVDKNEVDIKELTETDLTRYIESGRAARRDMAALGQIPAGDLGAEAISNISDATLAGLERGKNARAGEIATSLGESHEQTMRLMAATAGDVAASQDWASEVRWAEREARTWAGQIDGLVKLVQAQIMTQDTALEHVPNLTDQQVAQARADARRQRAASSVATLTAAARERSRVSAADRAAAGAGEAAGADSSAG